MRETALIRLAAQQMLAAGMNTSEGARELRKAMIVEELELVHGNVCRAARALGMHRNTLSRQMEDLGIWDAARKFRTESRLPVNSRAIRKLARSRIDSGNGADRKAA